MVKTRVIFSRAQQAKLCLKKERGPVDVRIYSCTLELFVFVLFFLNFFFSDYIQTLVCPDTQLLTWLQLGALLSCFNNTRKLAIQEVNPGKCLRWGDIKVRRGEVPGDIYVRFFILRLWAARVQDQFVTIVLEGFLGREVGEYSSALYSARGVTPAKLWTRIRQYSCKSSALVSSICVCGEG